MKIIPAIDLKGGKCVRLSQGEFTRVETYSEDPLKYALRWEQEGATRLHVVDLDGARVGSPQIDNLNVLRQIIRRVKMPIQLGGGIRTLESMERMLDLGINRVILGTAVAQNDQLAHDALAKFGDRIIIGIDATNGKIAISGWRERLDETAVAFAKRMVAMGAQRIIFTDIARDGMLTGVNTDALIDMLNAVPVPIIASGGVSGPDDIKKLVMLNRANLEGVIIGKALYSNAIKLTEAILLSKKAEN